MNTFNKPLASLALLGLTASSLTAMEQSRFTPGDIIQWERHSFSGETRYELAEWQGQPAVRAVCDSASASGLFFRGDMDLEARPVVEWEWFVPDTYEGLDETTKGGDDYPARLYAVDEHGLAIWRTRALNYVWANTMPTGRAWPNAYQSQAQMVAMQSGSPEHTPETGTWVTERRNLREDFQQFHDRDLDQLDALAIMTDCDDAGQSGSAWYGEIRLLPAAAD